MNICLTIGVDEAVRLVVRELEKFASNKLAPTMKARNLRRIGNVEVFFDISDGHEGEAQFHFVTHDMIEVAVGVNFKQLDREYLDTLVVEVQSAIAQKRKSRAPLVIHQEPEMYQ